MSEENPLADGLSLRKTPDPCALVIFGASGDLAHKKIMPALYALAFKVAVPKGRAGPIADKPEATPITEQIQPAVA